MMGVAEEAVRHLGRIADALERLADQRDLDQEVAEALVGDEGVETEGDVNGEVGVDATGSAYGISNRRFGLFAPKVVQRLLRDERSVKMGVLTSTIDREITGLSRETRRRVVERMLAECGAFISVTAASRGQAPYVRVTDVEAAKAWLAERVQEGGAA